MGRVTSRTDANGKVTQYGHDVLGRLTSVVQDAVAGGLNLLTQYGYDEVQPPHPDRREWARDELRVRPARAAGATRAAAGAERELHLRCRANVLTRADFSGKTTTFAYDAASRPLKKVPDPSFNAPTVTDTYWQTRRVSMTDGTEATSWRYDDNGNLTPEVRILVRDAKQPKTNPPPRP